MTERRYSDEEVAAIFLRASEDHEARPLLRSGNEGLTLADLQEIGRDVGISPDAVAHAARTVSLRPRAVSRTFLALPIGVERTVELGRWVTESEWERLVGELRSTFNARGQLSSSGRFRQWTNGNLQALLEPVETGHRLRLSTVNGAARASMGAGLAALGVGVAVTIGVVVGGQLGHAVPGIAVLSLLGLGMFARGALRLPSWARLRGRQMDAIAEGFADPAEPQKLDDPVQRQP